MNEYAGNWGTSVASAVFPLAPQILSYINKHMYSNMAWSPRARHNTMPRHRVDTETKTTTAWLKADI